MVGSLTEFEDTCTAAPVQRVARIENSEKENVNEKSIRLYPNPNDGNMILECPLSENENGIIIISDITGKQLQYHSFNSESSLISINAEVLNSGVYIYTVLINNINVKRDRVVIVK